MSAVRVAEPRNLGSPGMPSGQMISPCVTTVPSYFLKVRKVKVTVRTATLSYTEGVSFKEKNSFSQVKVSDYPSYFLAPLMERRKYP